MAFLTMEVLAGRDLQLKSGSSDSRRRPRREFGEGPVGDCNPCALGQPLETLLLTKI